MSCSLKSLVALILMSAFALTPSSACARVAPRIEESPRSLARRAALRLDVAGCDGRGVGTAFRIARNTLITNRHVAENATGLTVTDSRGHVEAGWIIDVASTIDIALVHVGREIRSPILRLSRRDPLSGDPIAVAGYPRGESLIALSGRVVDYVEGERYEEAGRLMRTSAEVEPGYSGGPLVTEKRRAGGIVVAIDLIDNYALVIPQSRIRVALAQLDRRAHQDWTACG